MDNYFDGLFKSQPLSAQVTHPKIVVGRYSYYAGYYHGHSFDDCALPLRLRHGGRPVHRRQFLFDRKRRDVHDGRQSRASKRLDQHIPFYMPEEEPAFADAHDAFQRAGDTIVGSDV
jgi:chloramphenicol O-acetyltransferase type B